MVEHWGDIAKDFVRALHCVVEKAIERTLQEVIGVYHQTGLYREIEKLIGEFLEFIEAQFAEDVTAYFEMELNSTLTMAHAEHKERTTRSLKLLTERRHNARAKCLMRLRGRADEDPTKILPSELGPDPFSQEVEMMAVSHPYQTCSFQDANCTECPSLLRDRPYEVYRHGLSVGRVQNKVEVPRSASADSRRPAEFCDSGQMQRAHGRGS